MKLEHFEVKKDMVSRYFHRDKWKDETGVFQYPRGKKRTDAILESLEIVFDKEEFSIEKELTLRGNNVLGNVFLVSVTVDDGKAYMALTITDHLFALMMLPNDCIDAFAAIENNSATGAASKDTSKAESDSSNIDSDETKEEVLTREEKTESEIKESNSEIDAELPIPETDSDEEREEVALEENEAEEDKDDWIADEINAVLEELPVI